MKERPILFSGPMVKAILDRRKTMTRRPIKPQPFGVDMFDAGAQRGVWHGRDGRDEVVFAARSPYGVAGDRLWVREQFAYRYWIGLHLPVLRDNKKRGTVAYRADGDNERVGLRWRPSVHMPHWASRITLEVEEVRVERVQGISDEEIEAEGIEAVLAPSHPRVAPGFRIPGQPTVYESPVAAFRVLWDSIHGAGAWERNDWCWRVTFRPLEVRNAG